MSIQIRNRVSRDGQKIWYTFESGKGRGERQATGMFTYTKPKNEIQENYNKEILALLEVEKHRKIIECHSARTAHIAKSKTNPSKKMKEHTEPEKARLIEAISKLPDIDWT